MKWFFLIVAFIISCAGARARPSTRCESYAVSVQYCRDTEKSGPVCLVTLDDRRKVWAWGLITPGTRICSDGQKWFGVRF